MKRVYLDNAATTPVAKEVVKAMMPFFDADFGNPSSLHRYGIEAKYALDNFREIIAKSINADPEEIVFTSGGSESDNLAIRGVAEAYRNKGNHIITTSIEHPAVLDTCKALEEEGFVVTYLNVDDEGFIDLDELEKSITNKTILVSVMHGNNEIGTIQDIKSISAICEERDVIFHTDAMQSFTKFPIDAKKLNAGLISFSAHKIHGPKGIGGLYINKNIRIRKMVYGGHQEQDYRAGTENLPAIAGFAKAVELCNDVHNDRMRELRDSIIKGISVVSECRLNDPIGKKRLCNNANFSFSYVDGEALMMDIDNKGIEVSTGSACSSQSRDPSHVLMAIGLNNDIARGSIRITLSRYNTNGDIKFLLDTLPEAVKKLREINPLWVMENEKR